MKPRPRDIDRFCRWWGRGGERERACWRVLGRGGLRRGASRSGGGMWGRLVESRGACVSGWRGRRGGCVVRGGGGGFVIASKGIRYTLT